MLACAGPACRSRADPGKADAAPAPAVLDARILLQGADRDRARIAAIVLARLDRAGVAERRVDAAEGLAVLVPKADEAKARAALAGGRIDVLELHERADPFAAKAAEHAAHYGVRREGEIHFLTAPAGRAEDLARYAEAAKPPDALAFIGPFFGASGELEGVRTFYGRPGLSVRGDQVRSASAEGGGDAPTIEIRFDDPGAQALRSLTTPPRRLLVVLDGMVRASPLSAAPIADGRLRFALARGGRTEAAADDEAKALAAGLDGVALGHGVALARR